MRVIAALLGALVAAVKATVLNKRLLFERARYHPHAAQLPLHKSRARNKVAAMGRRTGKSTAGGYELLVEARLTRYMLPRLVENDYRREFWIVGPEYTDSEKEFRVLYNALTRLGATFDKPGTYYNAHDSDMQISMYGGRFLVIGKSAMHPERLVGEGLHGAILAEAAKMRESVWTKYVRPMLADYHGWAQFNSTPEGRNWFFDLWDKGQAEDEPDWDSWRLPSWYNHRVFPNGATQGGIDFLMEHKRSNTLSPRVIASSGVDLEIAALLADLTEETFNQEIAALFTEFAGRVFKSYDDDIHVGDYQFNPEWETYAAVDYGFTNPFVWLLIQVDPFGSTYVLDEMYERGLTIDEAAVEVASRGLCPRSLRTFYPDPASPGDTRTLQQRLKIRAGGGTGGELSERLRIIRAALKVRNQHLPYGHVDRQPRLFINRKCTETRREFAAYRYPKTAREMKDGNANSPEKPLKKDDHTPEALGRFMIGHFGRAEQRSGVSDADMTG